MKWGLQRKLYTTLKQSFGRKDIKPIIFTKNETQKSIRATNIKSNTY